MLFSLLPSYTVEKVVTYILVDRRLGHAVRTGKLYHRFELECNT